MSSFNIPTNLSPIDKYFEITKSGSSVRTEITAGLTTFLAMVYSAITVPAMLQAAGFPAESVFIATCLMTGLGTLLMGFWAKLPMAIGGDIALTAFVAFSIVIGQQVPVNTALGMILIMGITFTIISVTGIRAWILRNLPHSIAHGAGVGIGLFLILVACSNVQIVVANTASSLPVKLGDFTSFPVLASFIGLFLIIALEAMRVKGGILIVIVLITVIGLIVDPNVKYQGFFALPNFGEENLLFKFDVVSVFNTTLIPIVLALVLSTVFDATSTVRAVAGNAGLVDAKGQIKNGNRALTADSVSSVFAGLIGTAPAAVYLESGAGTAAGGKTGLTAVVAGVAFLLILFFKPLAFLVPFYATAPALMYVGLLMVSNLKDLNFNDLIGSGSGLVTAVFIGFTANIVTGLMLGFTCLVIGRIVARQFDKLNFGTVIIAAILFIFYISGIAI
ncbi:permease [Psittacicella melopsittaci]|uniref:Permease n=1 Tax=Psittacicella melopsittaci TaxID=2028576 RepID=A0A3A1Y2W3_9GAMM|nr:NCS2 family permease [Psittacicella melopsittaci]RIY31905.1 permease [Psittacicella melopsittaci]